MSLATALASIFPPAPAVTSTQAIGNFVEGYWGAKPLFSNGVQIGNWTAGGGWFDTNAQDVLSTLCNQRVDLFDGVSPAQLDPTTWQTTDDNGFLIPAQSYCIQKLVAPNWLSQDQINAMAAAGGNTGAAAGGFPVVPLVIAGGLVLVSLMLAGR